MSRRSQDISGQIFPKGAPNLLGSPLGSKLGFDKDDMLSRVSPYSPTIDLQDIEWNPRVQNIITVHGNNNNTSSVIGDGNVVNFQVTNESKQTVEKVKEILGHIVAKPFDSPLYTQAAALQMELDTTELTAKNQGYIFQRLHSFAGFAMNILASISASFIFPGIEQPVRELINVIGTLPIM